MKFFTIKQKSQSSFKEKGSKFLAFAYPVSHEDEIKEILTNLRKEHQGAHHVCYAYRINPVNIRFRANDDGEPNHTAGTPILGQIQSKELVNVLLVVVRYFGGIKLGVPGLINAYKSAAADALNQADIVEDEVKTYLKIAFNYEEMNEVMKSIKSCEAIILSQNYGLRTEMELSINKSRAETLVLQLQGNESVTFEA